MKKYYNIFTLLVMALVTGLSLTACSEDDLDTNQYQQGVYLNVYGPSPVMRGGMLRFLGSNLNNVVSVTLPGCSPITNIEVIQAGVPSEIRIQVPKDGPEEGLVKLVTNTDQEIWTKTKLLYTEPIVIEGFTPASVMPGDNVTITGDYLNLVHMVEFADGVQVSETEFVSHDRYSIVVTVPEDARTGKISLYTADLTVTEAGTSVDYNIMQTDDVLEVGTPTIAKLSSPRGDAEAQGTIEVKAGETITLTGTYFNLAQAIKIGNVEITELTVSADAEMRNASANTLSFTLPAEAPDGEILLVTKSGVEVPLGTLVTVVPTVTAVAPNPVKAGAALTITGTDLDLVSVVNFPSAAGAEFTVNDATTLVITAVPETAQEGDIVLVMANGKEVTAAFTLVQPIITAYNANPVSAGGELQVMGSDLDLVKTVTFGDGTATVEEGKVSSDGTMLTVTVPMEGTSGAPKFNLANGTSVEGPNLTINEAVFCYATALPSADDENKAGETLTLPVANGDKLIGVQIDGVDCQYVLTKNSAELIIGVPDKAKSGSKVRLISSNGEITYTINFIPNTEVTTVLWTGLVDLAGWSVNWQIGDGSFGADNPNMFVDMDLQEGDVIRLHVTPTSDWWQMQFFNGHWEGQEEIGNATGLGNGNNINSGIYNLDEHDGCIEIPVTAVLREQLTTLNDWGYCWIIQGEGLVINKITATHYTLLETTLWKGELGPTNWSGDKTIELTDEIRAELQAGRQMGIDFKCDADGGQVEICGSWWTGLEGPKMVYGTNDDGRAIMDFPANATNFEWPLTQGDVDILLQQGAILFVGNGGLTITRWYVK